MEPHPAHRELWSVAGGLGPHLSGRITLTCVSPSTLLGAQRTSIEERTCPSRVFTVKPLSVPLTGKKRLARAPWNSRLQKEDSKDPHRQRLEEPELGWCNGWWWGGSPGLTTLGKTDSGRSWQRTQEGPWSQGQCWLQGRLPHRRKALPKENARVAN